MKTCISYGSLLHSLQYPVCNLVNIFYLNLRPIHELNKYLKNY